MNEWAWWSFSGWDEIGLNEVDFVAGFKGDDGLLVIGTDAGTALAALLVFAAGGHRVDATNRDLKSLLNGLGDLVLVGVAEHLEGILAQRGAELVGFLRETNEFENFVGLHQFLPPLTRAMIASSAFVLTTIFWYWQRSCVLSLAASCSETRSILRAARLASAENGA